MKNMKTLETVTLRQFYALFNKLTHPSGPDLARQEALMAVLYNGAALGDSLLRIRNGDPYSTRLDKPYAEAVGLARLLMAMGLHPIEIRNQDPPKPDTSV